MRRAARIDENQPTIVETFRNLGCFVQPLHMVGGGCPDLLVSVKGHTVLVEIKNPKKPKRDRQKTEAQIKWWDEWKGGPLFQVETVDDVVRIVSSLIRIEYLAPDVL